ncbi:MAG: hypothetical protein WCZ72_01280 [Gemmobacter sp.]
MEPDWFTLIAQIINFLVLVALLRHLFYRRLIGAMNAREADIRTRLDRAAQAREVAEQEAESYRDRNRAFEQQREAMLAQAGEEAETRRRELLENARLEAGRAQAKWLATLEHERAELLAGFRERLGQSAFALAGQGLKQLADTRLEEQIVRVFIDRIQTLDPAERDKIIAEVRGSAAPVEIHTAFALDPDAQADLTRALRQYLDEGITLRFAVVPGLICGIELRAHAYRLAWNLDSYLEELEARLFQGLEESDRTDADT